jgi:predicted lactoylglutathione lyase
MAKMIFVNLPVSDLARSTAFYQAIGAEKNRNSLTIPRPAWSFPTPSTSCC